MKATEAGRVIGKALEDMDLTALSSCPQLPVGVNPSTKCETITVFANLTDYLGAPVEVAMADAGITMPDNGSGLDSSDQIVGVPSMLSVGQQTILSFLSNLSSTKSVTNESGVFTDRMVASEEVISPQIVTDLLIAKKIKADSIDGLQIFTDQLASLSAEYTSLASGSGMISTVSAGLTQSVASSSASSNGPLSFASLVTFLRDVVIRGTTQFFGDVFFNGHVVFNADTAGTVIIPQSTLTADVVFERPYATPPVVTVTVLLQDATESAFLADASHVGAANVTEKGFTVVLDSPIPQDMTYGWTAIAVNNRTTSIGKRLEDIMGVTTVVTPTLTPAPIATSSGALTPTTAVTPTLTPTPIATSSGALTPTTVVTPAPVGSVTVSQNDLGFVRLRQSPSIDSTELGQIPSGTVLAVISTQNGWYNVTYGAITGWVSGIYVTTP